MSYHRKGNGAGKSVEGDLRLCAEAHDKALELRRQLHRDDPDNKDIYINYVNSSERVGEAYIDLLRKQQHVTIDEAERKSLLAIARTRLIECRDLRHELAANGDPANAGLRDAVGLAEQNLGRFFQLVAEDPRAAIPHYQAFLDISARLANERPSETAFRSRVWAAREKIAKCRTSLEQFAEAYALLEEVLDFRQRSYEAQEGRGSARALQNAHYSFALFFRARAKVAARVAKAAADYAGARQHYQAALDLLEKWTPNARSRGNAKHLRSEIGVCDFAASLLRLLTSSEQASEEVDQPSADSDD
ncbi:MAG: hypothetical protein AAF581_12870 [Planctomycetota bacterium]